MGMLSLSSPMVHAALIGALGGWVGAARVDYKAFQSWQDVHGALEYDWGVAVWRWFQGAVGGAVTGAGLGGLLGL